MIQIDMPMPKNCAECPCYGLNEFEHSWCNITGYEFHHNIFDSKAKDCPLKEQDELFKHEYWRGYNNGRADERGLQEGTIMQTFSPD